MSEPEQQRRAQGAPAARASRPHCRPAARSPHGARAAAPPGARACMLTSGAHRAPPLAHCPAAPATCAAQSAGVRPRPRRWSAGCASRGWTAAMPRPGLTRQRRAPGAGPRLAGQRTWHSSAFSEGRPQLNHSSSIRLPLKNRFHEGQEIHGEKFYLATQESAGYLHAAFLTAAWAPLAVHTCERHQPGSPYARVRTCAQTMTVGECQDPLCPHPAERSQTPASWP